MKYKKFYQYFTYVLILLIITSCKTEKDEKSIKKIAFSDREFNSYFSNAENAPVVKGRISNLDKQEIKHIEISYTLLRLSDLKNAQIKKYTTLKEDGTFELELDNNFPYQQIYLTIGSLARLKLYAKDELYIQIDIDSLPKGEITYWKGSGIKYSGEDADLNYAVANHIIFKKEERNTIENEMMFSTFGDDEQFQENLVKYERLYEKIRQIDEEFSQEYPNNFNWLFKNESLSNYYSGLLTSNEKLTASLKDEIKNY